MHPDDQNPVTSPEDQTPAPRPAAGGGSPSRSGSKVGVALAVVLSLFISAAAAFFIFKPEALPKVEASAMETCQGVNVGDCVADVAVAIAKQENPAAGLSAIRLQLEKSPSLQQGCHTIAHAVGKAFSENFGSEAEVPGNTWCSYGYYHGLMQEYGMKNADGIVDYGYNLCGRVESTATVDCMHGVGHAAYLVTLDIDASMEICSKITEEEFAVTCADAVIMEDIFVTNTGRMKSAYSPEQCNAWENRAVAGGCARGLAAELLKLGDDLAAACGVYDPTIYKKCVDGYGSALAGNVLSGSPEGSGAEQIASCSASADCAAGFGWIAQMYQINLVRAEESCRTYMAGVGLEACLESARQAANREELK